MVDYLGPKLSTSLFLQKMEISIKVRIMKKCFILFLLFIGTLSVMVQESNEKQEVVQKQDNEIEKKLTSQIHQ